MNYHLLLVLSAVSCSEISGFHIQEPRRLGKDRRSSSLENPLKSSSSKRKRVFLPRSSSSTALNLFSINFSGGNKNKDKKKKDKSKENNNQGGASKTRQEQEETTTSFVEEDADFSMWVEGLKQWPRVPSSKRSIEDSSQEEKDQSVTSSGLYRGVNPFSNLVNFRAILDLADYGGKVKNDENTKTEEGNSIFAIVDQLFKTTVKREEDDESSSQDDNDNNNLANVTTVEELMLEREEKWLLNIQKTIGVADKDGRARLSLTQTSAISSPSSYDSTGLGKAAEAIVKDATARIEYLVSEFASTALSPNSMQELILRASKVFSSENGTGIEAVTNDIVEAAEKIAKDRGLDVQFAADRARETTSYAANMVAVANGLFGAGYAYDSSTSVSDEKSAPSEILNAQKSRPLFADFRSARSIEAFQYPSAVAKAAEMGTLAGAIYEESVVRSQKLGHSIVANGTTADVAWMVTDSMDYESSYIESSSAKRSDHPDKQNPILVRTITIRGFDASDDTVDRERLLNTICTASAEVMDDATAPNVLFHSGLLSTARALYSELKKYIDWSSPNHRIVLNGHSIGGSLSILILLLLVCEEGADYVRDRILRVYAHGSPPIAMIQTSQSPPAVKQKLKRKAETVEAYQCAILEAFDLSPTMVYGYVQPYDPIVRFLTEYDPLYPLVDDLGDDEVTLYSTGPQRSLRPIARAIFQSWDGWPQFRESWKTTNQQYQCVGIQHLLLPEPLRYLNDRFVSANIGVPPTEAIVRISSEELLPALNATFPLDVFQISLIPQAVRSFLHHFYPAYDLTIANYAAKVERQRNRPSDKKKVARELSSSKTTPQAADVKVVGRV